MIPREPAFAFSIPSLDDGLALDCRVFHPSTVPWRKGAIMAHPYAPLGGSQDDMVVGSVNEALLDEGYVVTTFNFRGAGDSAGKTSWTGKPEIEDYSSVVGLVYYYLQHIDGVDEPAAATPHHDSIGQSGDSEKDSPTATGVSLQLLLGGYSYGSLILARLPPVTKILDRFDAAERGSAASEIFLRARTLAKQAAAARRSSILSQTGSLGSEGRGSPTRPSSRASPVVIGGDEIDSTQRRSSRDKRSLDVVREVPQRIKTHIRRLSGSSAKASEKAVPLGVAQPRVCDLDVRYLLVSPVLVPLTSSLLPPGLPSLALPANPHKDGNQAQSGFMALTNPALVLFGTSDNFTSAKRLRQWCENMARESSELLTWKQFEGAGHFWREIGAMQSLQTSIVHWLRGVNAPADRL